MRKNLQTEDLGDFLEQPKCAVLATHFRDGTVLLSPVWHEWSDGGFNIGVAANDIKVQHIELNAQVSISVAEDQPPYRGIEVRGKATIDRRGAHEITRRIAMRYLGPEQGKVYADAITRAELAWVRIESSIVRAWDFADEALLKG